MLTRREHILATLAAAGGFKLEAAGATLSSLFEEVVRGFLRNARATSPSYAVCDQHGGTKLKSCVAKSGKTYIGIARMLPALASCHAGGITIKDVDLNAILLATFRNAFDPGHPDYWEEPPPDKANQRQVEASLVAWSLWRLGDRFLGQLTPAERANIQRWLASCTRLAERKHNHAWFSAINQAARLALQRRWPEFSGDEEWMLADLKALDAMASPGDGWYQDSLTLPIYDYYNFWTFASHFLEWNQIAGDRYPQLAKQFRQRLRLFLDKAPYFFGANGSHALYGRSLIYRWAVLTPLVQAYEQGLWPHPAGLLRRIVRGSLEFHESIGSYDANLGKLRETYSEHGTPEIREFYIDNGHPYWCMQAYSFLALPKTDPFWTEPETPLPVERGDFQVRFEGPRMLLAGSKDSGQVRWIQSQGTYHHIRYRDKYIKFSYSSHFPFNIIGKEDRCPWDQTLVFRDPKTSAVAARTEIKRGELTLDGVQIEWTSLLNGRTMTVRTTLHVVGEFEYRKHEVSGAEGLELIEGSSALGLDGGERFRVSTTGGGRILRSEHSGRCVASWAVSGYDEVVQNTSFEETRGERVNVIHARMVVNTLCRSAAPSGRFVLHSLHYASPRPLSDNMLAGQAAEIRKRFS
jgi:hypothetical protein